MAVDTSIRSRRSDWLLPFGIALGAASTRLIAGAWPLDDAYITFRYARNFASGAGLVYNPDQWVLGTTAPLFALLLGTTALIFNSEIPILAVTISALADAVSVLMYFWLALDLKHSRWSALAGAAILTLNPIGLRYALGGMESALAAMLLLACIVLIRKDRAMAALGVSGLAVLVRPEALLLSGLLLLALIMKNRSVPWRPLAAFVGVLSPWVAYAFVRYGNPVPHSIFAKSGAIYHVYPIPSDQYVVNYAVPVDLIRDLAPDFLVSLDVFIRASLQESDWFKMAYQPIWRQDADMFGSRELIIFARKR